MLTAKDVIEVIQTSEAYLTENFKLLDKYEKTKDPTERNIYLYEIEKNQEALISYMKLNVGDKIEDGVEEEAKIYLERVEHLIEVYAGFSKKVNLMIKTLLDKFGQK